jgi:hypothetical protein
MAPLLFYIRTLCGEKIVVCGVLCGQMCGCKFFIINIVLCVLFVLSWLLVIRARAHT